MNQQSAISYLDNKERRALVLALCYQEERRKNWDYWYRAFPSFGPEVRDDPKFQIFWEVCGWLENGGWTISWRHLHWQGYIRFVFEFFKTKNQLPQPAQLKNSLLMRQYLQQQHQSTQAPARSEEAIAAIYRKILDPEDVALFV